MKTAFFRFHAELNDFLPQDKQDVSFRYLFHGNPSIKESVEAAGVPHVEIDLIIVKGTSVDFSYQLQEEDSVSIYPIGQSVAITPVIRLSPAPLREARFVLDVHLGKLASKLRMLGFDTLYQNDYEDAAIVNIAQNEDRILLTRDLGILMHKVVTRGYYIRSDQSDIQLAEVLKRFNLYLKFRAFRRCIACNGLLCRMDKQTVIDRLEPNTAMFFNEFYVCADCQQIYWKGSHYQQMKDYVQNLIKS